MKNLKLVIVLIGVSILFAGCENNLLQTNPIDQISPETFYQNENEAVMGLMGIYNSASTPGPWHFLQHDFMSDNNYMHHDWQGSMDFANWDHNSSSWRALEKWEIGYRTIGRANAFMENIEESELDQDFITGLIAEARFLRAYMYAELIHYFGDVPLILEVMSLEDAEAPRTPKEQVLESLLDDYEFAAANLPLTYPASEVGRATRGAALAMQSRILLYEERWEDAAEAAQDVIDLGVYSLFPDFEGIFREENENNEEVIFDFQYTADLRPQPWSSTCLGYSEWPTPGVTTDIIDSYRMSNGLAIDDPASGYDEQDPFTDRDPRLEATFVLPGTPYGTITFIPANDTNPTGMRPRKYAGIEYSNKDNCPLNWIVMRYADVLLMRAEALIESGNTGQEVYDLINEVRQRPSVNMPIVENVEGSGLSQDELRNIVRHERRVEFAMEATRYSDMRRWECEECVKPVYGYNTALLSDPNEPANWAFERILMENREFDPAKGWLWPIPQDELQNNPALEQNPGY